ncbi:hypothetical protein ACH5RR_017489, partial [Cinchona calisaya]
YYTVHWGPSIYITLDAVASRFLELIFSLAQFQLLELEAQRYIGMLSASMLLSNENGV